MAITNSSGKMLSSPCLRAYSHIDEVKVDEQIVDESLVVPKELGGLEKKITEVEQPSMPKQVSGVEKGIQKKADDALSSF